jgi:hypothetical protein
VIEVNFERLIGHNANVFGQSKAKPTRPQTVSSGGGFGNMNASSGVPSHARKGTRPSHSFNTLPLLVSRWRKSDTTQNQDSLSFLPMSTVSEPLLQSCCLDFRSEGNIKAFFFTPPLGEKYSKKVLRVNALLKALCPPIYVKMSHKSSYIPNL